jgi:hypothetical protein
MTWEEYKAKGIPGRLEATLAGKSPVHPARMQCGFAALGDSQERNNPEVAIETGKYEELRVRLVRRLQELQEDMK